MKFPLKIAILGCGGMGSGHARAIGGKGSYTTPEFLSYDAFGTGQVEIAPLEEKLVLAGIYDIDESRMKWVDDMGWHGYADYDDMLADPDVDIVLIATPNHLHREQAVRAMLAGKHVLCEKPVMMCSDDLRAVMDVARETGKVFYPRQNRRWDRDFLIIKKIVDEKIVGEVFNVESRYMGSRGIPGDWRGKKEFGGGMMLDWGVHLIDRLLMMIPEKVKTVYCRFTHITNDECDDGFKAFFTFESGMTALVEVGTCHFIALPTWYLAGKAGSVQIDNGFTCDGRMTILNQWEDEEAVPVLAGEGLTKTMAPRNQNTIEQKELPEVVVDRNGLYINLVDTISGAAEQEVTAGQALRVLMLMEACMKSDETGDVIVFE